MRIAAIYMTTGEGHVVFVQADQAWSVFPRPNGGARIYLNILMDAPLKPSEINGKVTAEAGVNNLLREAAQRDVGSVIDANATVEEVAAAFGLVVMTMRVDPPGMKCGINPLDVLAIAPALDAAGTPVGTNIFMRKLVLETDSRLVQVTEQLAEVRALLDWQGRVVQVGKPYVAPAANDAKLIVPDMKH